MKITVWVEGGTYSFSDIPDHKQEKILRIIRDIIKDED